MPRGCLLKTCPQRIAVAQAGRKLCGRNPKGAQPRKPPGRSTASRLHRTGAGRVSRRFFDPPKVAVDRRHCSLRVSNQGGVGHPDLSVLWQRLKDRLCMPNQADTPVKERAAPRSARRVGGVQPLLCRVHIHHQRRHRLFGVPAQQDEASAGKGARQRRHPSCEERIL